MYVYDPPQTSCVATIASCRRCGTALGITTLASVPQVNLHILGATVERELVHLDCLARTDVLKLERPVQERPVLEERPPAAAARVRPGGLSHPFLPDQSDPRLCGDLHPDDGLPCGWDHEGLDS